jgi:hypothetical protein
MKNVVLLMAVAMTLTFIACKKDKNENPGDYAAQPKTLTSLQGEWDAAYFLTGDGWKHVTDTYRIAFSVNGAFFSARMKYDSYGLETVDPNGPARDTVLNLYKTSQPQDQSGGFVISRLTKDTLILYGPYCINFCSTKYVRVK